MKHIPLISLSSVTNRPTATQTKGLFRRTFQYLEYGSSIADAKADSSLLVRQQQSPITTTICCDGRIPGVTLELTHWNGNATPEKYYADTSTEMALNLPTDIYQDACILNNHFDTDGVLSVFACLQPNLAQKYAELLVEGAAAGDFGEWTSDCGIQLDATLEAICQDECKGNEAHAYQRALEQLPDILHDLTYNQGAAYESLWKPCLDSAYQSLEFIQKNDATLERLPSGLVISMEPTTTTIHSASGTTAWLSNFALHRSLVDKGWWTTTNRLLRVSKLSSSNDARNQCNDNTTNDLFHYRYEKPGHGWVHRLAVRRPIPTVQDPQQLVSALEEQVVASSSATRKSKSPGKGQIAKSSWKIGGPSLVSICETTRAIHVPVKKVATLLSEMEETPVFSTVPTI